MMRVLIVDDEAPIRRLLSAWTQAQGATVVEAGTAEHAVSLIEAEGPPDVALCDVKLPGKDGLWLADYLRTTWPQTAVVMTTAVHEFDSAVNSLQAGVVDYLSKPYGTDRFVSALKNAFVVSQSRRAQAAMEKELAERRAQVTEALAELELNANSAVNAMLAMLHARDSISYDHAHRVSKLAVDLAMMLEIGEPQLSDIERAALLHNLGRLAMPDALLNRAESALTPSDRAQLRSYPLHGYAMLKNVPMLAAANQIAVATHERFDGSGFPHGLRGEQIPLGARIIGVADAYDELSSGIGYAAIGARRAIEILTTERKSQFDPAVLNALKTLQPTHERVS
jgi:response regulator RpfG family c-di-GMP phosphodiesterase